MSQAPGGMTQKTLPPLQDGYSQRTSCGPGQLLSLTQTWVMRIDS